MTISDIKIYRFALKLTKPLPLKGATIDIRHGLALRLVTDDNAAGWGEVSPLEQFSSETIETAQDQLKQLRSALAGTRIPDGLERFDGAFENWLAIFRLSASVRFGIESAMLNLLASAKDTTPLNLIAEKVPSRVTVNGLLLGTPDEVMNRTAKLCRDGFKTLKLKVGRQSIDNDLKLLAAIRKTAGNDIRLRLDANRSWNLDQAEAFMHAAEDFGIEYIEEPTRNLDQLRKLVFKSTPAIPVALDESLLQLQPRDLSSPYNISAVIIKPTLLGLERAVHFSRAAKQNGITTVISSAFESSLGLYTLASLAAAVHEQGTAAGLDTLSWFESDLCQPPLTIEQGQIDLDRFKDIPHSVKLDTLEPVE